MKQHNQIGKYTKKQDRLDAKKGRTFITPNNDEYTFDEKQAAIIQQAQKHSKYAVSALLYDDIDTAVQNLEAALSLLRPISSKN